MAVRRSTGKDHTVLRGAASRRTVVVGERRSTEDYKVVGIGASSGGLVAVRALLRALPATTGSAFLLVQHLDPMHESILAELISGDTSMSVVQAKAGMPIEVEHLYVIPAGVYMSVEAGEICLTSPADRQGARLPFDFLLHSLAREYAERTVAVVLSGTGADGSAAVLSVEAAGGLVIAQDPREAGFDGMPRNAIASANRCLVFPVAGIAKAIADYKPEEVVVLPNPYAKTDKIVRLPEIIDLLRTTSNDFSAYKPGTLLRRIEKRLAVLNIPESEIDDYVAMLRDSEEERVNLARDLLINVTGFFRDTPVFDFIREAIVPGLVEEKGSHGTVRIWVPGCSTGEEAYSLAMLFLDRIHASGVPVKVQVFASDADPDAVATAREGHYSDASMEAVPEYFRETYFRKEDLGYVVKPMLRSSVIFTVQNVLSDPPFSRIDLVSCRNLLIYLETEAQIRALSLFSFALRDRGYLVLGTSETVGQLEDRFTLIAKAERVYRRSTGYAPGEFKFNVQAPGNVRRQNISGQPNAISRQLILENTLIQAVLDRYAPAAMLINKRYEYLYSVGPTSRFLQVAAGPASHDFFALLPKSLHSKVRSAIHRATQDQRPFVAKNARIEINGEELSFSIHVDALRNHGEELLLVSFVEESPSAEKEYVSTEGTGDAMAFRELEAELAETRAELQGAIHNLEIAGEEQKAINAEALSLNEEYQSTNEELVTSKEELQSLNEELTALNSQLQETLERQRATSNDLENVLYSTDMATLFLDTSLRIRFFTPATRSLFNIIPTDIGRPFADLNTMTNEGWRLDALEVLTGAGSVEREVEARDGRWYIRRIKPYRSQIGEFEGVVLSFIDISVQKHVAAEKDAAKQTAERATEAKSQFLAAASHDLRQPMQTMKLLQGMLNQTVEDEQSRVYVQRLGAALASMSGILNSALDINQIEAGMVRPKLENFHVQDLLVRLSDEFSYPAQQRGLRLTVMPSSLAAYTDPKLLEQIVRNLLSNALRYTSNGRILLGCRRRDGGLRIEVWDTGIGIPQNQLEHVFAEYHQLEAPTSSTDRGLGLGLSIVRRLSNLLGINVSVASRQGSGSVFGVNVELARPGEPFLKLSSYAPKPPSHHHVVNASVLVIENEPDVRDLLKIALEREGHKVLTAASGSEALHLITTVEFVPSIVLADYNLASDMDGLSAIDKIRDLVGRSLPAIILTGNISAKALRRTAKHEVLQLIKPVKLEEVTQAVGHSLVGLSDQSPRGFADEPSTVGDDPSLVIDVVDDETELRNSIRDFCTSVGVGVRAFASAEEYLADYDENRVNCLVLDAHLPGLSGVDLLTRLKSRGHRFPIILITGRSDVQMAVTAMKLGAADFIEKPFAAEDLLARVRMADQKVHNNSDRISRRNAARSMLAKLTTRQREVLHRISLGLANKNIAAELGLSQRTVENHRASIMRRTESVSLSALLRLMLIAEET